jgi:hypothetical protein
MPQTPWKKPKSPSLLVNAPSFATIHCPVCGSGLKQDYATNNIRCECKTLCLHSTLLAYGSKDDVIRSIAEQMHAAVEKALHYLELGEHPLAFIPSAPSSFALKWSYQSEPVFIPWEMPTLTINKYVKHYKQLVAEMDSYTVKHGKDKVTWAPGAVVPYDDLSGAFFKAMTKSHGIKKSPVEIVPKESVKLDELTPALQEFMKDYTK